MAVKGAMFTVSCPKMAAGPSLAAGNQFASAVLRRHGYLARMITHICDRCGRPLEPGQLRYIARIEVLAAAEVDGQARPLVWTFQRGKSRVFGSITGHYTWTFDDPLFQILALRGMAWAAGEPIGRLERLK